MSGPEMMVIRKAVALHCRASHRWLSDSIPLLFELPRHP